VTLCSKRVPALCGNEAVELLYIYEQGCGQGEVYARCADHPAADDVAILKRVAPLARTVIEPIRTEENGP